MAEGILRQSYDSTGRKIYPLTVIDGILRSVDVNVMDGNSRGAYAIIDSMKNHNVDFAEADLTTLDVMTRTWNESTHSYDSSVTTILSVNNSGFKVDSERPSTFTGLVKTLYDVQNGKNLEIGAFSNEATTFTPTGRLSTKDEFNVLSGKIELFNSNSDTPFFVAENGQLSWKTQVGNGLTVNGSQLTYSGSSVVIGDLSAQTSDLTVGRDVTIGRDLRVKRDVSVDGSLKVGGGITFNGRLDANKDASIKKRLYVYDPSVGGSRLFDVSSGGVEAFVDTTITKNLTVNGVITAEDVDSHKLATNIDELNLAGNLDSDSLYFNYRAGSSINQIYMCGGTSSDTASGNLTTVISKSLQVGMNASSYSDSSLLLWTNKDGSPSIVFQRGTYSDGYTDWRLVDDSSILKVQFRDDSNGWKNSAHFKDGGIYIFGDKPSNANRFISSDATNNIYVNIDGNVPLVVEKNSVRSDGLSPNTDLGTSRYPWRTGYFDNIYSNNIFCDSIKTQGTTKYMSSIKESGWYKIGETSSSISAPASNTNIFIVNRSYDGWGGTEGYIISFVNDYRADDGKWTDQSSSVHVQITQISGNYGSGHLITKFATICNKYNTEYYMYYAGSDANNGVFISCIGTASPIAPTKTSKTDADMATGSIFYTDRGAGIRGDFYVNGNYNSALNGRQYVKISENTISAYTSTTATTLHTGNSPVSISKNLAVYGGITDYSNLTVTGTTDMRNKLTVTNGGIDIQNGDISIGYHLIFKNTATSGNSVNLIKVEEKNGTNRHLDIRTDGLYLSKGEYGQVLTTGKVSLNVDGSIYTIGGGGLTISGFSTFNNGLKINNGLESDRSIISSAKLSLEWRMISADTCDKHNRDTYGPAGNDRYNVNIWVLKENEKVYQVLHFDENLITESNALAIPSTYPAWTTVMVLFKDKNNQHFNFIKKVDANKILRVSANDMGLSGGAIYFICLGQNTYTIGGRKCREIHTVYRYSISIF